MRTLTFGLNGFRASVALPDEYFDERGVPRWHLLNSHFSSANIIWNRVIGGVQRDEPVVNNPQPTPITEELQKLREVVRLLEKKFPDGV
ncbi:MAG TPA: hypothetical protein VF123_11510 [Candidatus Sulfotelmatobacter sp.]